jgi:hypothetical protein
VSDHDDHGDQGGGALGGRRVLSASPLIWMLLVGTIGWAIWATLSSGTPAIKGLRAIVVPTDRSDRMAVVQPCAATASSRSGTATAGGTSVVLPHDSGARVVLVTPCAGGNSGAGASDGSSGAGGGVVDVLAVGTPPPQPGGRAPVSLQGATGPKPKVTSVFTVPDGGGSQVVVVPPCERSSGASGSSSGPTPPSAGHGLLLAPPCNSR